jgi:cytochrome c nitrite reductase small subunit
MAPVMSAPAAESARVPAVSRMKRSVIGAAVLCGLALGVGLFTFAYARGASYLTNDPRACANCHVMEEQYSGWSRSSHRAVAVCNDCHTPPGFLPKYATKALNGFNHSLAFTTGRFPDPIQITERNRRITRSSCVKCHAAIVDAIDGQSAGDSHAGGERLDCLPCHRNVGHLH